MNKNFVITEHNVAEYATKIGDWIKEQVEQANRRGVVLGMSGGLDCCVVARLCQFRGIDCHLIAMPYRDNMLNDGSLDHVANFVTKYNFNISNFNIGRTFDAMVISNDKDDFPSELRRLVNSNLMARIRMTYLYQYAQLTHRFVIGTSNLSERYVGYCTKWGDMACDINPLGNITKHEVYILAKYLQVPESIINKPPSAGFYEGQTDEEDLGITYNDIDNYILHSSSNCRTNLFHSEIDAKINNRRKMSRHKFEPIPMFNTYKIELI